MFNGPYISILSKKQSIVECCEEWRVCWGGRGLSPLQHTWLTLRCNSSLDNSVLSCPEAKFFDVVGTTVFRVFTVTFTNGFYPTHPPPLKSGLKLVCNVFIVSLYTETSSLRTLRLLTSSKLYVHEFGFCSGKKAVCWEHGGPGEVDIFHYTVQLDCWISIGHNIDVNTDTYVPSTRMRVISACPTKSKSFPHSLVCTWHWCLPSLSVRHCSH